MLDDQPINNVVWVHRDELKANSYNPNHVAPPEKRLLKISILEDGWTMPIVVRSDMEIVDGFHRWLTSADKAVYALTDGLVPVVKLSEEKSLADQMMSTIRHNRARGIHHVVRMSEIVEALASDGLTADEIAARLQMDEEEVSRLLDHGNMLKRGSLPEFNQGWVPTDEPEVPQVVVQEAAEEEGQSAA